MQRETNKRKVRLVRASDGSLRPSGSVANKDNKNDDLRSAWAAQDNFLASSNTTLKQELNRAKKWAIAKVNSHKHKNKTKKSINKDTVSKTTPSLFNKIAFDDIKPYITRRNIIVSVMAAFVLIGGISMLVAGNNQNPGGGSEVAGEVEAVTIETGVTPSFPVLSPAGSGNVPGGYARINPPNTPNVYAFIDNLSGVSIKVSQQKAPSQILEDASKIEDLAVQFGATESFDAGDIRVYVGKSADGPQSVLYTKGGLLILIAADQPVPSSVWVDYISKLRF